MAARLDSLEEHLETLQENIQQMGQDDVKRMMASLNALRDSIETYNTIFKD
jgi:spore cortex formation protein SpoVR/YcgB (stage V sporulation)